MTTSNEHNNAHAVAQGLERYEPTVMVEESRGRLTATGAVMKPKEDGRWVRLRDLTATPTPAPAVPDGLQWFTVAEHGIPEIGAEVIGGLWYTDPWIKTEFATTFMWGQCRVVESKHRDFKDGKQWCTFGPSHNQITHWARINTPGQTSAPAPAVPQGRPFGHFRAEPFGWTDCAATDDGAIALYEHPMTNPWRDAVIEQLESWHIYVPAIHDNSPRLAIKALVNMECKAALDPAVSSEAAALAAQGVQAPAPAVPQTVYLVENRTCLLAYASREDADKAVASMPASVGGGFLVSPVQVFGAPSPAPAPAQEVGLTGYIPLLEEVASSLEDYKNDAPWGSWDRERLERLYAIIAAIRAKGGK